VLVETAGASCDVRVRLYTPTGDPVGERIVSLAPLQYLQITDVFGLDGVGLGEGPFQNFEVTAQVVAGEGRPVALATVNDNISRNPEIFLLKESGAPVSTIGF
ncbi:MAG: hypothetical protein JNK60_04860, partial [Acidobacteria bacterium]|nr:hypothetical protein [Acidobacteriota bacterium]